MNGFTPAKNGWCQMVALLGVVLMALAACSGTANHSASTGGDGDGSTATAPGITTQPVSQSVTAPAAATFSVVANGTAPLAYQWRSSSNGTDWTDIDDATGASYATGATDAGMNGRWYSVTVSNSAGSVSSSPAQLTVAGGGTPPADALQPLAGAVGSCPHADTALMATPVSGSQLSLNAISWAPTDTYSGVATLTHSNGSQTRLLFPGGAFRDEVGLRLTEITGLGAPVSAVLVAVKIEPGDLLTEKFFTANFNIPDTLLTSVDSGQLVGFVADNDGSNLHLVPIVPGESWGSGLSHPAIKLDHMGIVGIAVATAEQQTALAESWPSDAGDQLAACLATVLTPQWRSAMQARVARYSGRSVPAKVDENPMLAPLRGYFNDAVVPAFAAAYGDPAQIPTAIQTGFTFLRDATLTGLSGDGGPLEAVASDLNARINTLLDTYADYVAQQCQNEGGPSQLQLMLGTIRQLQLLGHGDKSAELENILPSCSRFKVGFRQDFTRNGSWASGGTTYDINEHTVVEGTTTIGLNMPDSLAGLRLTTATLDETLSSSDGNGGTRVNHLSWVPQDDTSPWGAWGLSIPLIRTKGGTPSTSLSLTLHAYGQDGYGYAVVPLLATETFNRWDGVTQVNSNVPVLLPLSVPALPLNADHSYGPILIPKSGSVTSQATRTVPYPGGSVDETEHVTVTFAPAD